MTILQKGAIWITGISASGKTTLANCLYKELSNTYPNANLKVLDGEELRKSMDRNYGYSPTERYEAFKNVLKIVSNLVDKNYLVIVSSISYMKKMREEAKKVIPRSYEVYLDCAVEICARRDYKGHYDRAYRGEHDMFVGITHAFERSSNTDLVLNTGIFSIEDCCNTLVDAVCAKYLNKQINKQTNQIITGKVCVD